MPITTTLTLYTYDELSDKAKERAKEWYYECIDSSDYEFTIEDADRQATNLGITLDRREFKTVGGSTRSEPDINWSGFSSQGDGASFNGVWSYPEWHIISRIEAEAPQDKVLRSLAQVMHDMYVKYEQHRPGRKLRVHCKYSRSGMAYAHSGWMDTEWELDFDAAEEPEGEEPTVSDEDAKVMRDTLRGFADWIYSQLSLQNDYLYSDENVEEAMHANEYTFEVNGRRRNP